MDTNEIEEKILKFFHSLPHALFIALFGSYAKGAATSSSDVDFAVFFERSQVPSGLTLIDMIKNDVLIEKTNSIQNCLKRIYDILRKDSKL